MHFPPRRQIYASSINRHQEFWWNDVDVLGLYQCKIDSLGHDHIRFARQKFCEHAFMRPVKMLNEKKRTAGFFRQRLEQGSERIQSTR
ncbi:hypothetical protein D3C87_1375120 [compost metagenome]